MPTGKKAVDALLVAACIVVIIAGLRFAEAIVTPFLLSVFIATIAAAPISWLRHHRVPNGIAISLVVILLVGALIGIGILVGQTVSDFYANQSFYQSKLTSLMQRVVEALPNTALFDSYEELTSLVNPGQALNLAAQLLSGIGNVLSNGFLILLTTIFILAEGTSLPARVRQAISRPTRDMEWFDTFGDNLNRYIAIKTVVSAATGLIIATVLTLMGVDFALLWGLLAFLLNYIPNIGSFLAAVPAVLVALVQFGLVYAGATVLLFFLTNILMGAVIEPRYMGRILGLTTLVVFVSVVFWGWILGPVGMLLSVPLTMTFKIAVEASPSTRWIGLLLGPVDSEEEVQQVEESSE